MDRPSIHKYKHMCCRRPVHRWQSGKSGEMDLLTHGIQHDGLIGKAPPHDAANTALLASRIGQGCG